MKPLEWLSRLLALRHTGRLTAIKLTIRTFQFRGIQFRCDSGPWRDSLPEAIMAHKARYLELELGASPAPDEGEPLSTDLKESV